MRNEPARTAGGQPLPVVGTQVVTLPNVLSFLRLVGVPVFLWAILTGRDGWALVLLMALRHHRLPRRQDRPAATAWSPGSASCSTRSPTGSTSSRRCSAWPGATSSRGGWSPCCSPARSSWRSCCWWSCALRLRRPAGPLHRQGRHVQPALRLPPAAARPRSTASPCVAQPVGLGLRVVGHRPLLAGRGAVRRPGARPGRASAQADGDGEHPWPVRPPRRPGRVDDAAHRR